MPAGPNPRFAPERVCTVWIGVGALRPELEVVGAWLERFPARPRDFARAEDGPCHFAVELVSVRVDFKTPGGPGLVLGEPFNGLSGASRRRPGDRDVVL
jgi:hypothetical protein